MIRLSDKFRRIKAPETGRTAIQLTYGNGFCYPMYYYIPSITSDEKYLVYHQALDGGVQLYRLEFETGASVQITHADYPESQWHIWCTDAGKGVLDHRSAVDIENNRVIYMNGNVVHVVDIDTLEDRVLFKLDDDRIFSGQNCFSEDGKWFAYIHHDRELYRKMLDNDGSYKAYYSMRHISRGTELCAYNMNTGENRTLVRINSPIHHVAPYGNTHFVFCHLPEENGMMITDIKGGWFTFMRTQDEDDGMVDHYVPTKKGIAYDVQGGSGGKKGGMYDPFSNKKMEVALPKEFGYVHVGGDPEGKIWFYENHNFSTDVHDMHYLVEHSAQGENIWKKLTGNWPTYGKLQKSDFHPRITQDRNWIIFTGGDPSTRTNHIFLLDISDLEDTIGVEYAKWE